MPREALEQVPLTPSGALLRRPRSPVPQAWPEMQQENFDTVITIMEREATRVLDEAGRLSAHVTEQSAGWHAQFGNDTRQQQRSNPPPTDDGDGGSYFDLHAYVSEILDANGNNNVATRGTTTPRLSLAMESDDASDSELDLSVLAMARGGGRLAGQEPENTPAQAALLLQQAAAMAYDEEVRLREQYEAEDTSIEGDVEEEEEEEEEGAEALVDPASIGLKEISNLGKFTVSSHKPGNGVQELRSDDLKLYWQSDGPQPHKLTVYFVKRVGIRVIRFFVDYQEDESYTPTKIVFRSGTSENNLIEFATMTMDSPYGWQDVPISGAGGDPDGNTLVSYVLQMQILENHQNGKDTHLRGIKIYAFDPDSGQQAGGQRQQTAEDIAEEVAEMVASSKQGEVGGGSSNQRLSDMARILASSHVHAGEGAFSAADFLREPELR